MLTCFGLVLSARAQSAPERVLLGLVERETPGGWELRVSFSLSMRYVRHAPRDKSDFVIIELEPVGLGSRELPAPGRESLRPRLSPGGPPLREIFLGVGERGTRNIELRFSRKVDFEVIQEDDLEHVSIRIRGGPPSPVEQRAAVLVEQGRDAISAGDNDRAIQIYTKVLSMPAPRLHSEALEYLGLARERNGQRAHAKAEYEQYLERFPDADGAPRVRQRLQALIHIGEPEPQALRPAHVADDSGLEFGWNGSLSAHYSRSEFFLDGFPDQVTDSSQITDAYLNGRVLSPDWELEATLNARERFDFRGDDLGGDTRINSLLLEFAERGPGFWANLGRQRGDGGVLGRFDGGRIGYRPNDWIDVSALGGFVTRDYASDRVNTDRYHVGLVANVLEIADLVDAQFYTNYVREEDLTYRAAIGGELRHLRPRYSAVVAFDYDAHFNEVNLAMLLGDVQVSPDWSLNAHLEYRSSPFITLGNAMIGQPVGSLSGLAQLFSSSQMKNLAEDRTAHTTTFTLGSTYRFDGPFEVTGAVTAADLSGTDTSGGVIGMPGTGYEYNYYLQLVGYRILHPNGVSTVAVTVFDGDYSNRYGIQLNGRYPLLPRLRLNPIVRLEVQDVEAGEDLLSFIPRLRLDYTIGHFIVDLDIAWEMRRNLGSGPRPDEHGYALYTGVRYDF